MKRPKRLPKELKVGGLTYKVKLGHIKSSLKGGVVMGQCDSCARELRIDKKRCNKEEINFVLFHELAHAAMDAATHDEVHNDDTFLHPFTRFFWDVLVSQGLIDPRTFA